MGLSPAQFLGRDDLVGDGLDHVRAGHEHVGAVAHHEDEVGHRGGIDRPARARPHDDRDLRDDAGGEDVLLEDIRVTGERRDTFLDARPPGIVQPDDRRADAHGHVHDLADLLRMGFGQRPAQHGEVLGEHIDLPPVHGAPAGDDAIARVFLLFHAEIDAAVRDEHVVFLERPLVQQQVDALARGQLALGVLAVDAALATTKAGLGTAGFQFFEDVFHGVSPGLTALIAYCSCED